MSCHTSVLSAGHCPHPPHAHLEEEILVVLDGVAEIELADTPYKSTRRVKLAPGNGVYYPALQKHTIYNPSASPVTYLMLKWRAQMTETITPLGTVIFNYGGFQRGMGSRSRKISVLFEGPTAYLGRAQSHCTELQPDAGYAPHRDPYDVAIVLLEGTIETLGRTLTPHAVVYIAAGEPHGMHNPGTTAARYLVFEFEPSAGMGPVQAAGCRLSNNSPCTGS
jgi:mannose-6-phosphate isomerase-like protein (cupin superfamily)